MMTELHEAKPDAARIPRARKNDNGKLAVAAERKPTRQALGIDPTTRRKKGMNETENSQMIPINDLRAEANERTQMAERQIAAIMSRGAATSLLGFKPARQRKLLQEALKRELEMGLDYRHQAIGMALELRLQSFRETCNQVLVDGKTSLRQQRLEYFTRTYAEVEKKLNELTETFLEDLDQRFKRLDRFSSDILRKREKQRLEKRLNDFLDVFDQLMENFAAILNEEIDHKSSDNGMSKAREEPIRLELDEDETASRDRGL